MTSWKVGFELGFGEWIGFLADRNETPFNHQSLFESIGYKESCWEIQEKNEIMGVKNL